MFFRKRGSQRSAVMDEARKSGADTVPHSSTANQSFEGNLALNGLKGLKILLAEDHRVNAKLLIEDLEYLGAQVTHAINGDDTCRLAVSNERFDVILMDCQMPVLDGFQAAQKIRAWEAEHDHPPVPIIALTGLSREFEQAHSVDAGMNGYLVKPFSTLQLATSIQLTMAVMASASKARD